LGLQMAVGWHSQRGMSCSSQQHKGPNPESLPLSRVLQNLSAGRLTRASCASAFKTTNRTPGRYGRSRQMEATCIHCCQIGAISPIACRAILHSVVNVAELGRQMVAISFFNRPAAVVMISG